MHECNLEIDSHRPRGSDRLLFSCGIPIGDSVISHLESSQVNGSRHIINGSVIYTSLWYDDNGGAKFDGAYTDTLLTSR